METVETAVANIMQLYTMEMEITLEWEAPYQMKMVVQRSQQSN